MTAQSGSVVISPITTFLGNDSTLLSKFANLGLNIFTLDEFTVDYVSSNDLNLSKLSQLLYVMLKDTTLLATFKTNIALNEGSLDNLFLRAHTDLNASASNGKFKIRLFLNKVNDYNGTTSDMESLIKNYKNALISSSSDGNSTILRTGQTVSSVANDDGTLQRGVARSYTDNSNGTVIDNATTLIWQKEDDNSTYTWVNAGTYCDNLNLGGSTAWRLATIEELVQLTDKGTSDPLINAIFINTNSGSYWSSTSSASDTTRAWSVDFNNGFVYAGLQTTGLYVRCVRSAD